MLGLLGVVDPGAVADPRLVASVLEIRSGGVFVRWRCRCLVAPVGSVGGVDGGVSWLGNGHPSAWSASWLAQQIIPFLLAGSEDLVSDLSPSQPVFVHVE
ncbi:unnamed protein product [Brassica rapa subsp. narinosa]